MESAGPDFGCGTHHDIQPAEELDGFVDRALHVRLLAHICLDGCSLDVGRAFLDERERLLGGGKVDVHEEDVGAFLREK